VVARKGHWWLVAYEVTGGQSLSANNGARRHECSAVVIVVAVVGQEGSEGGGGTECDEGMARLAAR
jgi:hypothetical protein